ncbi:MerR family transcriptional regulator [Streptomyces sp. NPDC050504]|uniref:MerR family transcriptional regulator n=1 Tax=Streptomyces sp. NPDC050504 TaxID=3365618 RepID=UPI00378C3A82
MDDTLTIGAFARATRLSAKALRHYDELGLLRPARVDPFTGYRHYGTDQLERARLIAWLRRIGMPLAEITRVHALPPAAAAREIREYWARVEAETAARRDLATFLIDHLTHLTHQTGKDAPPMNGTTLTVTYAAASDTGLVRTTNQDTAYAGARLQAVADGYGSGGAEASAAAVWALKRLENVSPAPGGAPGDAPGGAPAGDLLNVLHDAVELANHAVERSTGEHDDSGTTLTAMLWTGSQLALVHVGDSRAYLLRDGELLLITHDHTVVAAMVEDGRLTADEAASHPQRAMLLRALDGGTAPTADVRLRDALPGDRYLLCSDGLHAAVADDAVREVLTATAGDPDRAVRALVDLARAAGAPDNVACVVADVAA